jgi:hypothetical protein
MKSIDQEQHVYISSWDIMHLTFHRKKELTAAVCGDTVPDGCPYVALNVHLDAIRHSHIHDRKEPPVGQRAAAIPAAHDHPHFQESMHMHSLDGSYRQPNLFMQA